MKVWEQILWLPSYLENGLFFIERIAGNSHAYT
jgi:hypothetical protein